MKIHHTLVPLLLSAALGAGCGDSTPPAPAKTSAPPDPMAITATAGLAESLVVGFPEFREVREVMRLPARIEVDETRIARMGSPVAGRIVDLHAGEGQRVKVGQVLATISSTELSGIQLNYLKAISQRGLAARSVARAQQLYEADVLSAAELQRRQAELAQAEAEVNANRDQLRTLGMSANAIATLESNRTINSVSQVVATLSGVIIERKVTEGQVVQPADGIFLVADLSQVWVVADVPEQNSAAARLGEDVVVEIAALPDRLITGSISFVSPTVNPETRTVRARMTLANPRSEFKPAMLASMLIKGKSTRRLTIPSDAVVREDNRDLVFASTGQDQYRLMPVQLGAEQDGRRVIESGLRESDNIVVSGAFHLNNERKRRVISGG